MSELKHVSIGCQTGAKNTVFVYKNWEVKDKFVDLTSDEKGISALNAAIGTIVK